MGYSLAIDDLVARYAGLSTFVQLDPEVAISSQNPRQLSDGHLVRSTRQRAGTFRFWTEELAAA
jgi:hypothetical protein